jgi:sensor histidine kinase YesM
VENAILHGIRKKGSCGTVIIRTTQEHDAIVFAVVDDGIGMTTEQIKEALSHEWHEGKGVGLSNIHKRLTALYGQGLTIISIPEEKTEISFRIGKRESAQ